MVELVWVSLKHKAAKCHLIHPTTYLELGLAGQCFVSFVRAMRILFVSVRALSLLASTDLWESSSSRIQISFRFSVEGSGVVWVMVGGHWILWIQWIVCVINFRRRKNILHLLNRHFERANYDVTL